MLISASKSRLPSAEPAHSPGNTAENVQISVLLIEIDTGNRLLLIGSCVTTLPCVVLLVFNVAVLLRYHSLTRHKRR